MKGISDQTAVVTVVGQDTFGIIAKVSHLLYQNQVNIKDISQTIMQDEIFTMIMVVDLSRSIVDIKVLSEQLEELGRQMQLSILLQHGGLFNAMHRI